MPTRCSRRPGTAAGRGGSVPAAGGHRPVRGRRVRGGGDPARAAPRPDPQGPDEGVSAARPAGSGLGAVVGRHGVLRRRAGADRLGRHLGARQAGDRAADRRRGRSGAGGVAAQHRSRGRVHAVRDPRDGVLEAAAGEGPVRPRSVGQHPPGSAHRAGRDGGDLAVAASVGARRGRERRRVQGASAAGGPYAAPGRPSRRTPAQAAGVGELHREGCSRTRSSR